MGEQQSQKHGLRSESQKEEKARDAYKPIPPSNPVSGAFGGKKSTSSKEQAPSEEQPKQRAKSGRR
jgi:hypothetical protein